MKYVNETNQIGEDENGKKIEDSKGILKFIWDGRRDNGFKVAKGNYTIRAEYVGNDSKKHTVFLGSNIVESVQFKKSEPQLKMGDKYVAFSKIGEIR